ncbi:cysteine desulfurase [Candidatus Pacearchaeota archaeon]|nr:cysteine desulfurase [Candidatus Pacearchaeota archaeon]
MNKQIYFDNAATTKIDESVLEEIMPYLKEKYGNPSSDHELGREAKEVIENSRKTIAKSLNAKPGEIYFTSGGTESNNLAIKGLFFWYNKNKASKNHIITTKIEHDCVLKTCKWLEENFNAEITYLDTDKDGFIDLKQLKNSITDKTFLVSVIHGNNEIGTIQDLEKIGEICKEKNILLHTDACQSYTKSLIDVKEQNLDLVTINSHKIHGPKGIGALYINPEIKNKIYPLFHGGGHEFGLRSGTENVAGIVGFAKAVEISNNSDILKMQKLRDGIIKGILKMPNTKLNGATGENRLCNNINISFSDIEGESIGGYLENKGIFVSTGSACSSKSLEPSHVLLTIGLTPLEANSSIRISLSKFNTEEEINYFLNTLKEIVIKLREMSPIN